MKSREEIVNEYLTIQDVPKAIQFLISQAGELLKAKRFEDGTELLNIGHIIVDKANVPKEQNPYVVFGTKFQLFCYVCNRFKIGTNGECMVTRCQYCNKTFCPEHAKKNFLLGAKCPICGKRI